RNGANRERGRDRNGTVDRQGGGRLAGSLLAAARRASRSRRDRAIKSGGGAYCDARSSLRILLPFAVRTTSLTRRSPSFATRLARPRRSSLSTTHVALDGSLDHASARDRMDRPASGSRLISARLSAGVRPSRSSTATRSEAVATM